MRAALWRWLMVLLVPVILAGCKAGSVDKAPGSGAEQPQGSAKPAGDPDEEAEIQAALATALANGRHPVEALQNALAADATIRDYLRLTLRYLPERQALE